MIGEFPGLGEARRGRQPARDVGLPRALQRRARAVARRRRRSDHPRRAELRAAEDPAMIATALVLLHARPGAASRLAPTSSATPSRARRSRQARRSCSSSTTARTSTTFASVATGGTRTYRIGKVRPGGLGELEARFLARAVHALVLAGRPPQARDERARSSSASPDSPPYLLRSRLTHERESSHVNHGQDQVVVLGRFGRLDGRPRRPRPFGPRSRPLARRARCGDAACRPPDAGGEDSPPRGSAPWGSFGSPTSAVTSRSGGSPSGTGPRRARRC